MLYGKSAYVDINQYLIPYSIENSIIGKIQSPISDKLLKHTMYNSIKVRVKSSSLTSLFSLVINTIISINNHQGTIITLIINIPIISLIFTINQYHQSLFSKSISSSLSSSSSSSSNFERSIIVNSNDDPHNYFNHNYSFHHCHLYYQQDGDHQLYNHNQHHQ